MSFRIDILSPDKAGGSECERLPQLSCQIRAQLPISLLARTTEHSWNQYIVRSCADSQW